MIEGSAPSVPAAADVKTMSLRSPSHRIERRVILLWTVHVVCGATVVLGGLGLVYLFVAVTRPWLGPLLVVLAVIFAVNLTVMPTWRYLVHRWESTDQAVYSLKGWLTREWRIAPISRIQTIDTTRGPLQQLLRLATLKVTTASREGSVTIPGLDATVAAAAAQQLTEVTQIVPGDAT